MKNQEFNKAENAVDNTENALRDGAQNFKNKASELADKARAYIKEQKEKNEEPTEEGWFDKLKNDASEAWENTKDAASEAWQNTKNFADESWEKTKDAAEDVKAEINKATN